MCKVGTSEVVEEDPAAKTRYAFFSEDSRYSIHAEEDSMTACINICRLMPGIVPTCIGFLMTTSPPNIDQVRCVPLFEDTGMTSGAMGVRVYTPETGDRVFNIEGCIA